MSSKRLLKDWLYDFSESHRVINLFNYLLKNKKQYSLRPNISRTHRNYYIINKSPLIIYTTENIKDIRLFSKIIGVNRDAIFLITFWWTIKDNSIVHEEISKCIQNNQKQYPKHEIILLLNTIDETKTLLRMGMQSKFIHQNSLVDIEVFKPLQLKKQYDIIYNGRLDEMKRHYLLRDCKNIGFLSAYVMDIDQKKEKYLNELKRIIPQAFMINSSQPMVLKKYQYIIGFQLFTSKEVNTVINQSKVGVILSAKEGACYASIEYLLAGIPVVSTINLGGRDYFLDDRFCRIVKSNPSAVKKAVDELIALKIDPFFIRNETIKKMKPHLNKFKNLIKKNIQIKNTNKTKFNTKWDDIYINKMIKYSQEFPKTFINDLKQL